MKHFSGITFYSFQAYEPPANWPRLVMFCLSLMAIGFNLIELCCYVIFFGHVCYHDNRIAILVVKQDVVHHRNHTNAVSMVGLLATWIMELGYFSWVVYFLGMNHLEENREMLTILKMAEFVVVPTVQVLTSPHLKRAIFEKMNWFLLGGEILQKMLVCLYNRLIFFIGINGCWGWELITHLDGCTVVKVWLHPGSWSGPQLIGSKQENQQLSWGKPGSACWIREVPLRLIGGPVVTGSNLSFRKVTANFLGQRIKVGLLVSNFRVNSSHNSLRT